MTWEGVAAGRSRGIVASVNTSYKKAIDGDLLRRPIPIS